MQCVTFEKIHKKCNNNIVEQFLISFVCMCNMCETVFISHMIAATYCGCAEYTKNAQIK